MSKISLTPVKYYDVADVYSFEVDNRPLYDLSENIDKLNTSLSSLGFYQEAYADIQSEPAGGFLPYTCAMCGSDGRLYPIDITLSALSLDYSKVPVYLVLENLGNSYYKCITFSASLNVSASFSKFLSDSVGRALKIGPSGTLVDEIYFDIYYSSGDYQNITVGKVLTASSISFGGNQVSILGSNGFLPKNKDAETTGLITRVMKNDVNSTSFRSTLSNTKSDSYLFTEYVNSQDNGAFAGTPGRLPVYFSSRPLSIYNGSFTEKFLDSVLNEVHFASPSLSADTVADNKYKSAGINVRSLLDFANSYLVHSKPLSDKNNETVQTLSTSLLFDSADTSGLSISFGSSLAAFGVSGGKSSLNGMKTATGTSGLFFGTATANMSLYHLTNTTLSTADFTGTSDADANSFPMSSLVDGSSTLLKVVGGIGALFGISSEGPVVLSSDVGVFCSKTPLLGHEISNKYYVDQSILSAINSANSKIPLIGATAEAPVTGSLYFDTKGSSTDTSLVLQFDTLSSAKIASAYPIEVKTLGDQSVYQSVRGITPEDLSVDANPADFTTRAYINNLFNVIDGGFSAYVSKSANDTITGIKTFSGAGKILAKSEEPITLEFPEPLTPPAPGTEFDINIPIIRAARLNFVGYDDSNTLSDAGIKLTSGTTVDGDSSITLTTKGYVEAKIPSVIESTLGLPIFANWSQSNILLSAANVPSLPTGWYSLTSAPTQYLNFTEFFSVNAQNGLTYHGDSSAIFSISVNTSREDEAVAVEGESNNAVSQAAILVQNSAGSDLVWMSNKQDSAVVYGFLVNGSGFRSRPGAVVSGTVLLEPGDKLFLLGYHPGYLSGSLVRIR